LCTKAQAPFATRAERLNRARYPCRHLVQEAPAHRVGSQISTPDTTAGHAYEDAFAVDVPGMSVPQNGCDETGVKPVLFALTIHAQLFESWPKSVA
jgi:hypothetical protein